MATRTKSPPETSLNGSTKTTKPPGKTPVVTRLTIPEPKDQLVQVRIRGIAPLLVHSWNFKALQQLADKSSLTAEEVKEMQNPEWRFQESRYISTEGWDGVPAGAFKEAITEALPVAGIPKEQFPQTLGRVTFFITEDGRDAKFRTPLVRIEGEPEPFSNLCRLTNGTPYPNTRAMYPEWSAILRVRYNGIVIDRQSVLNLIAYAGYYVGICEHRPSCPVSKTGTNGRWEIVAGQRAESC